MEISFINDPFEPISSQMDATKIQESSAYRNLKRAEKMAEYLINEDGVMDLDLLDPLIQQIEKNLYPLQSNREMDSIFLTHQLNSLKKLKSDKELRQILFSIDKPENHKKAEEMIQRAVGLDSKAGLTKAHARRAALSAWLTLLRQNVGSCFATAPALLIQQEHPIYLLKDLNDLFSRGMLKRVIAGNEHIVPLSQSFGIGDLRRPIFLTAASDQPLKVLANSPGILKALKMAGIEENPFQLLKRTFEEKLKNFSYLYMSIEEILKSAILKYLEITERDLEEFEARTRPTLPYGIIEWAPNKTKKRGKSSGELCSNYYAMFDSAKNGFISLTDHPVLKAWEFTLASFCETQSQFSKWNLYSSLGMDPKENGGIGSVLYKAVSFNVDRSNQKMLSIQDEYQVAWQLLQGVESKIRLATSEQELRWIRAEYLSKKNEFYTLEELRDRESMRGKKLANLFQFIIDRLIQLFPKYFQEVYDPDLKEVSSGPYDDAPCGFRLMFKHGRQNTSAWTFVKTYQEFIDALTAFFNAFEVEYSRDEAIAGIEKEFTDSITQISLHIKTEDFINSAFERMAIAHNTQPIKDPLKNLDKVEKKPWAYTSGGTMANLVANYFGNEVPPSESGVWVESPQELLIFLEDAIKKIPYKESEKFIHSPYESFLIHSPTHAFRFMPGLSPFNKAWQDRQYTYTYVRDHYVEPAKKFYNSIRLDDEMIRSLINELRHRIPEQLHINYDLVFRLLPRSMSPQEFSTFFNNALSQDRTLALNLDMMLPKDEIDAMLFANIPYMRRYQIEEKAIEILWPLCNQDKEALYKIFEELLPNPPEVLSSKDFFNLLLTIYAKVQNKNSDSKNIRQLILDSMQEKELRPPLPQLFADSNWQNDYFGFLVSPSTMELEFWRLTPHSMKGAPMTIWKRYLDGSVKNPNWGIYNNKTNYS